MSAIGSTPAASTGSAATTAGVVDNTEIASNFTEFLQLLTTQLQNQDPLSPMDTNQFTQQLVEFAQVEQQMKSNDSLSTLVSLQQSAQTTQALQLVGSTVVVNGSTAQLANGSATWSLNSTQPATATVTITAPTGQTAFTGTYTVNSGAQTFNWNGQGNDGTLWPAGNYTLTATATSASGQSTAISTQVQGTVSSVDLTQTPPVLLVGGQNYTMSDIQQIVAPSYSN
ncbi:MAG TPA: flagellar hook capping FlgD N-terminal domain-containing protein [Pseudolabrys sp.]|jgi:flagellar basal-body rod modification protein FlgD|nr:flagellar hook capping FlgD N-terminal domain-containing protein [Pseudolabrys sp.]